MITFQTESNQNQTVNPASLSDATTPVNNKGKGKEEPSPESGKKKKKVSYARMLCQQRTFMMSYAC